MSLIVFVFSFSLAIVDITAMIGISYSYGEYDETDVFKTLKTMAEQMTYLDAKLEQLENTNVKQNRLLRKHEKTIEMQNEQIQGLEHNMREDLHNRCKAFKEIKDGDSIAHVLKGRLDKSKVVSKPKSSHKGKSPLYDDGGNNAHQKRLVLNDIGNLTVPGNELTVPSKVAFSAYLSHDLNGMAGNQTVVFDSTILNDGDFYNPQDGTFNTPIPGIYLISFVVNTFKDLPLWVKLVVNGVTQSNVVIWPHFTPSANMQGSNMVLLRLQKNDRVWIAVDEQNYGTSLHGGDTFRATTFSGVLLYE